MAQFQEDNDSMCDDSDIFDNVVMAENRCQAAGFEEGFQKGEELGREQGLTMGIEKGRQIGDELGFYFGFIVTWRAVLKNKPEDDKNVTRPLKIIESLISIIQELPKEEPNSVKYWDIVQKIRSKFKQVI
ncbi:protein LTO1 homolog [Lytechinus pictus]|uniref:protein LTO1 homolog n=1 Tax=Lytechinus pictus TaxID=7653 RepID=UPI0030B9DA76